MNAKTGRGSVGGKGANIRHKHDAYFTPRWCTESLLDSGIITPEIGTIWEPSCGDGAISKVLIDYGYNVVSTDLIDHGYGEPHNDFFETERECDGIITNPPFNVMNKYILRAIDKAPFVAILGRLLLLEGQWRKKNIYSKHPPHRVLVLPYRPSFLDPVNQPKGGMVAFAWFVWKRGSTEQKIEWL